MQSRTLRRLRRLLLICVALMPVSVALPASHSPVVSSVQSQQSELTVRELDRRLREVESRFPVDTGTGAIAFLYGAVCALWATNTGRNPWLWFFLGLLLSVLAALVMLYKNGRDRQSSTPAL